MTTINWKTNKNYKLSKDFNTNEFNCKCGKCGIQAIDTDLINKIQLIRESLQVPLIISSGYRCINYQAELAAKGYQTATGISSHTLGQAVDILFPTQISRDKFISELEKHFKAIGIAKTFVHVDLRSDKTRRWYYAS